MGSCCEGGYLRRLRGALCDVGSQVGGEHTQPLHLPWSARLRHDVAEDVQEKRASFTEPIVLRSGAPSLPWEHGAAVIVAGGQRRVCGCGVTGGFW